MQRLKWNRIRLAEEVLGSKLETNKQDKMIAGWLLSFSPEAKSCPITPEGKQEMKDAVACYEGKVRKIEPFTKGLVGRKKPKRKPKPPPLSEEAISRLSKREKRRRGIT